MAPAPIEVILVALPEDVDGGMRDLQGHGNQTITFKVLEGSCIKLGCHKGI